MINGTNVENVSEFKYLGITIHKKKCSFKPTLKHLKTKATRAIYALKSKINFRHLKIETALKLFDAMIKPILLYGSEVWEPYLDLSPDDWDKCDVEKCYTQFLKQLLGVNRSTTTILVRGELMRHSLQEEILRRNIKYATYINEKSDNSYVKQAYNYELSRELGKTTFHSTINKHAEALFTANNFSPYADPYVNIYKMGTTKIRSITGQLFQTLWKEKLETSSKADTYKTFKTTMKFEPYLRHNNRQERVSYTKLRTSDHKLRIEEMRHRRPKPPRHERTCHMCQNQVEDEIHFLTTCQLYGNQTAYWNHMVEKCPQIQNMDHNQKFIYIMTQEDGVLQKKT